MKRKSLTALYISVIYKHNDIERILKLVKHFHYCFLPQLSWLLRLKRPFDFEWCIQFQALTIYTQMKYFSQIFSSELLTHTFLWWFPRFFAKLECTDCTQIGFKITLEKNIISCSVRVNALMSIFFDCIIEKFLLYFFIFACLIFIIIYIKNQLKEVLNIILKIIFAINLLIAILKVF